MIPIKGQVKHEAGRAFTLIELLSSVAVIAVLLGILMPVLTSVRCLGKRVVCKNNLRQLGMAWDSYLVDHEERFLQGVNTNHEFGGWKGDGFYSEHRPLNPYLDLPVDMNAPMGTDIYQCPADTGGVLGANPIQRAYNYCGNSYQTNTMVVGPNDLGVPSGDLGRLHQAIRPYVKQVKRTSLKQQARLVFMGDNSWIDQWSPFYPHRQGWHGKPDYYNVAFLDGHIDFVKIRKGLYVADVYHVLPFESLFSLACEVQEEVPYE